MGVKQKPTQSAPANGVNLPNDKDREREKRRKAAESNVGKEFQTVSYSCFEKKKKKLPSLTDFQLVFVRLTSIP